MVTLNEYSSCYYYNYFYLVFMAYVLQQDLLLLILSVNFDYLFIYYVYYGI